MRPQRMWLSFALAQLVVVLPLLAASSLPDLDAGTGNLDLPEIPDVDVLEFNVEMAQFLAEHVLASQSPTVRLYSLMDVVFSGKQLGIQYETAGTKTAVETFESRSGNCLSFTYLFVAMARHLGLHAYFQEVGEVLSWDRRGDVILRNQHMYVEIELENSRIQVDFLPGSEKRYRLVRRINDRRALAHYYNNIGAEKMAGRDHLLGVAYFARAVGLDDSFAHAWTNLGVAYRRLGEPELAERSHLRAIDISNEMTAVSNLASLYVSMGRREEAEPLLQRAETYLQRNPFHHFRLGVQSSTAGNAQAAIEHFRAAIRRMPKEPEFHAALSRSYAKVGDTKSAEVSLRKAIRLADTDDYRVQLREELAAMLSERMTLDNPRRP